MPIRPIDPAKRGLPSIVPSASSEWPAAEPAPGHQPHPKLGATSSDPNTINMRPRIRPSLSTSPSGELMAAKQVVPLPAKRAHHVVDRTGPNWANGDYIVGKGRPPKARQWQKGQSGNPRGPKPHGKLSLEEALDNNILDNFTARVNGEEVKLNMGEFAVQLLKAGAAKGIVKSQIKLLELFLAAARKSASRDDTPAMEEWEQQVIDQMLNDYRLPEMPVFRKTDRTTPDEEPL